MIVVPPVPSPSGTPVYAGNEASLAVAMIILVIALGISALVVGLTGAAWRWIQSKRKRN